jgi:SET family sugar efflux transporter-like MFS transporter
MLQRRLIPLASLFWGLQFAFLSPSLALILVSLYHATPSEVGWVLATYNAAGFVVSLVVPAWADRRRQYLWPLLVCSVLNLALTIALTLATSLPWVTVALVVFGAPAGAGMSLIFAQLVHGGAGPADLMNNRAIVSFAWVAAPPIATALIGWFGPQSVLLVIAGIALGNVIITLVLLRRERRRPPSGSDVRPVAEPAEPGHTRLGVAVIVVAFVLVQATNAASTAVITLYVSVGLGLPVFWAGLALAIAAGLEIPALIGLGRLTGRFPLVRLMLIGCLCGIGYYVGMALVREPWALLALQALNAVFVATVSGVGVALFQQIIAGPGFATGLFSITRRVGNIAIGPLIAIASTPAGYPGIFLACAVLALVGGATIGVVGRRAARRAERLGSAD